MAKYKATIKSIASDGTNLYVGISVTDGATTFEMVTPQFPVGTTPATITAYAQTIADNAPTLDRDLKILVGTVVTQA